MVPLRQLRPCNHHLVMLPAMMQTVRTYADTVIKVPQMAESISEGTLKQFTKSIGDYVELDEEIATIETDKVCIKPRRIIRCARRADNCLARSTSPSMPPRLVRSRSFWSTRRIPLQSVKILFA